LELSIDTSTRYASVALSRAGEMVGQYVWRSERNHSVELAPALRQLMERTRATIAAVEALFVARGPGGFSALRVGISLAKSLAAARSVPLVGVPTLDIEARPYLGTGLPVCAVIEAGRGKVYAARYGAPGAPAGGLRGDSGVYGYEDLVGLVTERTLFCGEGTRAVAELLRSSLGPDAMIADSPPPTRNPSVLAEFGYRRLQAEDTDDPETLQPLYMHGSQYQAAQRKVEASR
jgi:tRNA threonylcarbamoyladenosine biosynthesis protein TsaB